MTWLPEAQAPYTSACLTAARLTAILFLLRPVGPWLVHLPIEVLSILALAVPRALRSPALWFGQAILMSIAVVVDWPLHDNHLYLLAYWSLAIALAFGAREPAADLASSSRWLIGGAFACAVLWKLLAPDFLDHRFFRVTLLTDPRFEHVARLVGNMGPSELAAARELLVPLPEGAERLEASVPPDPPALAAFALALTAGALGLELMVALAMLAPTSSVTVRARHGLLLLFCAATYLLAPVAGFGWLLLAMGLAQCGPDGVRLQAAYLSMFGVIAVYDVVPWADLLLR